MARAVEPRWISAFMRKWRMAGVALLDGKDVKK
jgi:hypothetical protein